VLFSSCFDFRSLVVEDARFILDFFSGNEEIEKDAIAGRVYRTTSST
tara:strand:- start:278 stop:418 length:141 start_codon:yes stop_codon:yes gene_type:complete